MSAPTIRAASGRALLALVLCLPALLLAAGPASAHAGLLDSDPADGARLERAPQQVTLSFNEDIQRPAYVVVRAGGEEVASGEAEVAGPRVTAAVPADAAAGEWSVAFRVVSTDGHPVTGELGFTVAEPPAADPSETPSGTPSGTPGGEPSDGDAADEPSPAPAQAGTAEVEAGLWERHGDHVLVGAALLALAAVVLVLARRSR